MIRNDIISPYDLMPNHDFALEVVDYDAGTLNSTDWAINGSSFIEVNSIIV